MSRKKKGITKSSKQISKTESHKIRVKKANKKFNELKKEVTAARSIGRDIKTIVSLND